METEKITIHKDQKCPVCKDNLVVDGKIQDAVNFSSKRFGVMHDKCHMPYFSEKGINLLVKLRCYSMGDSIAGTPIVREIRRVYPEINISVMTFYPDLYKYNPYIQEIFDINHVIYEEEIKRYPFQIDAFNSEAGGHYAMHSVEFSAVSALNRSLAMEDWGYEVNFDHTNLERAASLLKFHGVNVEEDTVFYINPHGTEWETRDWGKKHGQELVNRVREKYPKAKIFSIGGKRSEVPSREMKNYVPLDGVTDIYGKLSILDSIAMFTLPCSKLLITPDTGTLHLGACSDIPIVGIFTLVKAEFRTPVRNRIYGYKFKGINSDSDCCCTYNARFLTDTMKFNSCPKRTFLQQTRDLEMPNEFKITGLKNLGFKPEDKYLNQFINNEVKKFDELPCFPSVEKVMKAIGELLQ